MFFSQELCIYLHNKILSKLIPTNLETNIILVTYSFNIASTPYLCRNELHLGDFCIFVQEVVLCTLKNGDSNKELQGSLFDNQDFMECHCSPVPLGKDILKQQKSVQQLDSTLSKTDNPSKVEWDLYQRTPKYITQVFSGFVKSGSVRGSDFLETWRLECKKCILKETTRNTCKLGPS